MLVIDLSSENFWKEFDNITKYTRSREFYELYFNRVKLLELFNVEHPSY